MPDQTTASLILNITLSKIMNRVCKLKYAFQERFENQYKTSNAYQMFDMYSTYSVEPRDRAIS